MPEIHLDPAEFSPIIEMAVEATLRRLREERPTDQAGRILLSKQQAAEALGVSPSTIDRLRREVGLPCVKLNGLVLFRPEALRQWATKNEQRTSCTDESKE